MKDPAVFLDRDGTIIEDAGYIGDPDAVRLLPGAVEALRRLADAGFRLVLASNQSGVARGIFDEGALARVHARLEEMLAAEDVHLDAAYYCPYLAGPEAVVEKYRRDSELRKPRPGMLLQAARDLELDLSRSWMIGDHERDAVAGWRAGCRTILLRAGSRRVAYIGGGETLLAHNLMEAAQIVERNGLTPEPTAEAPAVEPATSRPAEADAVHWLARIHEQLEHAHRTRRQDDFSVLRLFGALLQMFALVAVIWGLFGLFDGLNPEATARFALACYFQLASLSAFAVDRFR